MKRFAVLTALEIKKSIKALPKLIPGAILMIIIVLMIALGAKGILSDKPQIDDKDKVSIGVVCYDDSKMMELAKRILTSTKSITESIHLTFMEEKRAEELLEENRLMAVIIIPDNVVSDIMTGKNTPIDIRFSRNAGYEAAAFKEIADAAVNFLASAQAGIYSVYDFYNENNQSNYIDDALDRLNERYIKTVLLRESFFENTQVVATGDLDVMEYYCVSGIVLFLFLFGINSVTFTEGYRKEAIVSLCITGTGIGRQHISRLCGIFIVYAVFVTVIIAGVCTGGYIDIFMAFKLILSMVSVLLSVSSIILFIQVLVENKTGQVMIIFFAAVFQSFVTGGFIPELMLPKAVTGVGKFTPAYYMIEQIKAVYMGSGKVLFNTVILAAITLVFMILSYVCTKAGRKV